MSYPYSDRGQPRAGFPRRPVFGQPLKCGLVGYGRSTMEPNRDNPLLRRILTNKEGELLQDDYDKFIRCGITDILLPFPAGDRAVLPHYIASDDERVRLFHAGQEKVVKSRKRGETRLALEQAFEGVQPAHLNIRKPISHYIDSVQEENCEDALGEGGYSKVYAVRRRKSTRTSKPLALKTLSRPMSGGRQWSTLNHIGLEPHWTYPDPYQNSFQNEIRALREIHGYHDKDKRLGRIRDCHIIQLRATFTDPSVFGLLLSPVALCDLDKLIELYHVRQPEVVIRGKRLQGKLVNEWLHQSFGCLAAGLLYLHRHKIRHKDIKPKNILVEPNGNIRICDFATALVPDHVDSGAPVGMTRGAVIRETHEYTTPERMRIEDRDFPDDLYALGLVFLELITVIKGRSREDLESHLKTNSPELSNYNNDKKAFYQKHRNFIPILGNACSNSTLLQWLNRLRSTPAVISDLAIDWVQSLLSSDPSSRWNIEVLLVRIKKVEDLAYDPLFWRLDCCSDLFAAEGNVQAACNSRNEKVLFKRKILGYGYSYKVDPELEPQESSDDKGGSEPSTLGIIQTSSFERRLVITGNASSSFPPEFDVYKWLTLVGIRLRRSKLTNVTMEWCDCKQLLKESDHNYGEEYWRVSTH
ncbi:kinase-like domain-containing protein [Xylariaceae sp. FL0804]|nr:kinase-like domain-containing protein [Xylariaceae sp. FL0804]